MRVSLYILVAFVFLLTGCEDSVSPSIGEERPFTVFGYLDPSTSTQLLRVIPIVGSITEVDPSSVDAEVRTIHNETGTVTVWRQLPVQFSDSTEGVVYSANFTPEYESHVSAGS